MFQLHPRLGFAALTRAIACAVLVALAGPALAASGTEPGQRLRLTPDQRRDMWERLSPEQREMMLRRLPPEQRRDMWRSLSPEERQAMRHRFTEQRPPEPGSGPPPRPMHHMSPEERQRLREQIREAQRDVYRGKGRDGRR